MVKCNPDTIPCTKGTGFFYVGMPYLSGCCEFVNRRNKYGIPVKYESSTFDKTITMDEKLNFLRHQYISIIRNADSSITPKWGKMNFQQMLEHVSAFFKVSTKKIHFDLVSPAEHLPRLKEFLMSDKQFRENTKAPVSIIGEEPFPTHYATIEQAVDKLENEVNYFFNYFNQHAGATSVHPVFGELNFEEWVRLHYKHVTHHLRQFGLL